MTNVSLLWNITDVSKIVPLFSLNKINLSIDFR